MKVDIFDLNRSNLNRSNLIEAILILNRNELDPQPLLFKQPFAYMDYLFPVVREVIWQSRHADRNFLRDRAFIATT
ncbi:hypothetical protein A9239_03280 [Methanosarcina sp. A14]|nr:hypothetical protein A9239_03280 [Methanosarcina sp. A14]